MLVLVLLLQSWTLLPPTAADHVVTMERTPRQSLPRGVGRTVVHRSGTLLREDVTYRSGVTRAYVNLARNTSVVLGLDDEGRTVGFAISANGLSPIPGYRRLAPTGRRDREGGKDCGISRMVMNIMPSGYEVCETADGIQLWRATWYPAGGSTRMESRATTIERRPVLPAEVLPPRDLLALTGRVASRGATGEADYEVHLTAQSDESYRLVLRRRGGLRAREWWSPNESRWLDVTGDAAALRFAETKRGQPLMLSLNLQERPQSTDRWEVAGNRQPEQLLGETCIWLRDRMPPNEDGQSECRTRDGIPLMTETRSHNGGMVTRSVARSFSRRTPDLAHFTPPARALDWGTWGITPAP